MKNTPSLYAGTSLLDLDGATVAVTLTANSYEQPDKVNSSYTNSFTIPWTRPNQEALGALTADERTNKQYEIIQSLLSYPASIDVVGNLHIFESDNNQATAAFVAGVASLFDALGDETLQCAVLNATFDNDANGYAGERNNVYTDGYSTAYADFQEVSPTANTVSVNRLFPFPFFWQVVQDVCELAGWTCLTTGLLADSFFRKVAFAYNGEKYKEKEYFSAQALEFSLSAGAAPGNFLTIDNLQNGLNMTALIEYDKFDYTNGILDLTGACGLRIYQMVIDSIDITTNAGSYHFELRIYSIIAGVQLAYYDSGLVTGAGATVSLPSFTLTTDWNGLNGCDLRMQLRTNVGLNVVLNKPTFRFADGRDGFTDLIWGHDVVYPYAALPDIKCTDFLKQICFMFGAIPRIDLRTQTVEFVKFETIATDFANAQDWTGKFDGSKPVKMEWRFGEYGRLNTATYDNDDDVPKQFGNGTMTVTNQQLPATYDWLSLLFSSSITVPFVSGAVQMARIPVFDENDKLQELNPRCVYLTNETSPSVPLSPQITDGVTTVLTTIYNVARFDLSSDTNSLSWGGTNGLIASYHASFNRMLNRMHKLTAYFNLSAGDFAGLNFFAPVYISYSRGGLDLNGWYILQEVKEYDGRETVEVELLKIDLP